MAEMDAAGVPVQVSWKSVKRLTLAVNQHGRVRVSAPLGTDAAYIRKFVMDKLPWITRQREEFAAQCQKARYMAGEEHMVWGKPHILAICPCQGVNDVILEQELLRVRLRGEGSPEHAAAALAAWRRNIVRQEAAPRVERWRLAMSLPPIVFAVRNMKSRWGSCVPARNKITLNAQLSRLPHICLDGVIVHELAHCLVPSHSQAFYDVMGKYFPAWREVRQMLKAAAFGANYDA